MNTSEAQYAAEIVEEIKSRGLVWEELHYQIQCLMCMHCGKIYTEEQTICHCWHDE